MRTKHPVEKKGKTGGYPQPRLTAGALPHLEPGPPMKACQGAWGECGKPNLGYGAWGRGCEDVLVNFRGDC